MNAVISSVVKTQSVNFTAAAKHESEAVKSAEEVTGGQNTAVESSISSKYDTLDLSRDYLEYKTQSGNSSIQDETSQLNATIIRPPDTGGGEAAVYQIQLYSYTETELLDMVNHAEISWEEYEAEIGSRNAGVAAG